jgi:hypothetical protein
MLSYLRCIKSHRGSNDPECRNLSKSYLSCRMDRYVLVSSCPMVHAPLHITPSTSCGIYQPSKGERRILCYRSVKVLEPGSRDCQGGNKEGCKGALRRPSFPVSTKCGTSELSNRRSSSPVSPLSVQALSGRAYRASKRTHVSTSFRRTASAVSESSESLLGVASKEVNADYA